MGWSGVGAGGRAKVSSILCHRGVQLLILAYSWARPAILVVGKGRGGMFLILLFLPFHSCSSFFPVPLFHLFYYLFYLFSSFLWETAQNDPQGLTVVKLQYNQCPFRCGSRRISEEVRFNHITAHTVRIRTDRPEQTV